MPWLVQPRLCSVWEHRTVWWYTGQCPVRQVGSSEQAALGTSTAVYSYNSPDCPVVHRTVRWAVHRRTRRSRETINGVRLKFTGLSGEPTVGRAICAGHVAKPTTRRGHRTCPVRQRLSGCQRSTAPFLERNRAPDSVRCASRQKARSAFQDCSQRLLAALGL
jgi:hypothetical protein